MRLRVRVRLRAFREPPLADLCLGCLGPSRRFGLELLQFPEELLTAGDPLLAHGEHPFLLFLREVIEHSPTPENGFDLGFHQLLEHLGGGLEPPPLLDGVLRDLLQRHLRGLHPGGPISPCLGVLDVVAPDRLQKTHLRLELPVPS